MERDCAKPKHSKRKTHKLMGKKEQQESIDLLRKQLAAFLGNQSSDSESQALESRHGSDAAALRHEIEVLRDDTSAALAKEDRDEALAQRDAALKKRDDASRQCKILEAELGRVRAELRELKIAHDQEIAQMLQAREKEKAKHQVLAGAVEKLLMAGRGISATSFAKLGGALQGVREAVQQAEV